MIPTSTISTEEEEEEEYIHEQHESFSIFAFV